MNFVKNSFGAFLYAVCAYLKTEFRAAAAASLGAPSLTVVPSDCAMVLRSRRTKDGGIIREMPLSMRVPIVSPTNDEYSCRELSLFEWWEKSPEGKEGANLI